ncbi:MAG: nitroreductase family protein [Oscillospiraceae bacterium]|jgi:nitroreductase/NAD-dependent dihydropyrimidine dehydrogenase PreA subunit
MKLEERSCIGCWKCVKDCFSRVIQPGPGHAVLADTPCIECFHCIAVCPTGAISGTASEMKQVRPYEKETFSVRPEQLKNLMEFRRSVRQFQKQQITEEELHGLLEAARYSPTAGNRQPLRYIVLQEKLAEVTKQAITALGKAAQQQEALGPIFGGHQAYATHWARGLEEYETQGADGLFYHAPTVLLFVGPETAAIDAGIASSRVELLAASMGLGACYVAFFRRACLSDPGLQSMIGIAPGETPLAILALGRSAVQYFRTVPRREAKVVRM